MVHHIQPLEIAAMAHNPANTIYEEEMRSLFGRTRRQYIVTNCIIIQKSPFRLVY